MRTLHEVRQQFPAAAERGLTAEQVLQSRQRFGSNRLTPVPREPLWRKFLGKFDEPIIKILLAAALLSMLVDLFEPPAEPHRYSAGGIAVAVVASVLAAAYILKRQHWIPSLLFLAALVFFPIG